MTKLISKLQLILTSGVLNTAKQESVVTTLEMESDWNSTLKMIVKMYLAEGELQNLTNNAKYFEK